MKENKKLSHMLGFSKLESKIFNYLPEYPQSISNIGKELRLPRTSVYGPVESLRKRGFVEVEKIGRRLFYKKTSHEFLINNLKLILNKGDASEVSKNFVHPEFFLHTGKEDLIRLYNQYGELRGQRLMGIQSNRSADAVLNAYPFEKLLEVNKNIKKNGVIIEGLLQEGFVDFYKSTLKKRGLSVKKAFESFGGRAADTTYVPKEFLNSDSEIMILPKAACIFNWTRLVAIEIRNKETVGLFRDLFALAKYFGRKVDQNKMVLEQMEME